MFSLLCLLIAQAWSDNTITLISTGTADCTKTDGEHAYKCLTIDTARALGDSLDTAIKEYAIDDTAKAFSGESWTATLAAKGYKINDAGTTTGATLDLSTGALTIGDTDNEADLEVTGIAVKVTKAEAVFAAVVNGALTLTDVTFACEQTAGAEIYLKNSLIDVSEGGSLTLAASGDGCSFTGIYSEAAGACITAIFGDGATFVPKATFEDCQSKKNGGAFSLTINADAGATTNLDFTGAEFTDCKAAKGNIAVIAYKSGGTFTTAKPIVNAFLQEHFIPNTIVDASGKDAYLADPIKVTKDGDYKTLTEAVTEAIKDIAAYSCISSDLDLETSEAAGITLSTNLFVDFNGKSLPVGEAVNGAQFSVAGDFALYLYNMKFSFKWVETASGDYPSSLLSVSNADAKAYLGGITAESTVAEANPVAASVITYSAGTLEIYASTFTGFILKDKPLFTGVPLDTFCSQDGTTKNTISTITRLAGNGAVFELDSVASISLKNLAISGCTATKAGEEDGLGAILYAADTTTAAGEFEYDNVAITSGTAASGNAFYFVVKDDTVLKYYNFIPFLTANTGVKEADIMVKAGDEDAKDISKFKKTIKVQVNTTEVKPLAKCGGDLKDDNDNVVGPCPTLKDAVAGDLYQTYKATGIAITGDLAGSKETVTIDHYMEITGSGVLPNYGSSALLKISAEYCSIDGLTFTYDKAKTDGFNDDDERGAMITVDKNAVLVLKSSTFKVADGVSDVVLTASIISAASSSLTLSKCTFDGITLKDSPLLTINAAKGKFTMEDENTFKSITLKSGSGAVFALSLAAGNEVAITGATFDSCTVSNGCGGAIAAITPAGTLTITKCTFNACGANKGSADDDWKNGFGGAIALIINDGTPSFTFSELAFTSCTGTGSALAVICADTYMESNYATFAEFIKLGRTANVAVNGTYDEENKAVKYSDLYKLIPETAKVDATNGEDSATCGEVDEEANKKACKTFAGGLATWSKLVTKIEISKAAYAEETAAQWNLAQTMSIKGTTAEDGTDRTSLTLKNYLAGKEDSNFVFYIGNGLNTMTVTFADLTIKVITDYDTETDLILFNVSNAATLELINVTIANDTQYKKLQTVPIVEATKGKVSFTSVTFENFYMDKVSLLNIPADHFSTFTLCNFNGITKASGNGAVLSLSIVDGMNFNLAFNNFTSCKTLDGNGGAVYINYNKGNLTIGNQEFNETKKNCTTLFKTCSAAAASQPTPDDGNVDAPTAGAGGAIYLNLEGVDEEKYLLNITSVLFEECTATNGSAMYAHATTEEGTKLLENKDFWKVITKINGNKKDQFTILDNEGNEEKPKGSSSGFPIWAIIVIIVVVVVVIVIIVIIIVCCCCRSSS